MENLTSRVSSPAEWLERHGDYLYSFAFLRVRHSESAEDLVQESLLSAWKNRDDFNALSSERTWLTAILKRKIIDFLRRRIREHAKFALSEDGFIENLFDRRGEWRACVPRASRQSVEPLDRDAFWQTTSRCLGKLPSRLHDVFVLRYLDDISSEEICSQMQVSSSNLWVMLHRARLRMWSCLTANWFQDDDHNQEQQP